MDTLEVDTTWTEKWEDAPDGGGDVNAETEKKRSASLLSVAPAWHEGIVLLILFFIYSLFLYMLGHAIGIKFELFEMF